MPSFVTVTSGNTAQAQDVNQIINALNGSAGNGVPISLTALNDSVNFALAAKNADATNSRAFQVLRSNNNVLIQADVNGVIVSPDGGATTGQVLTTNGTQTLTNKTLTAPHLTSPVVDSGGLTSTGDNQVFTAATSTAFTLLIRPADNANTATNIIKIQNATGSADVFTVAKTGLTVIGGGGLTVSSGTVSLPANSVSGAALSLGQLTNAIGADVTLNNTATYFDGPSVAQGTVGTWFVSGTVVCLDTAGAANFRARLWDGTTTIASSSGQSTGANTDVSISMSGYLATPAGNLRISVEDATATTGKIRANPAGLGTNASYISAIRIG